MLGFNILNYLGITVFAISGALKGIQKELDFFGVFVASLLTAIGGGAIRDILVGEAPQFIHDVWYFVMVTGAVVFTALFRRFLIKSKFVVYMDAVGLGTFAVLGAGKGMSNHEPVQAIIMIGLLSGIGGGIIRDVLLREIPMVLKGELYATAALCGIGLLLFFVRVVHMPFEIAMYISAASVALIRGLAFAFHYKIRPL